MELEYRGKTLLINKQDLRLLEKHKWRYIPMRSKAKIQKFYLARTSNRTTIYFHRAIMGHEEGMVVDHINRNTLDFRRKNLRFVTQFENRRNSDMDSANTSGYRNVTQKGNKFYCYSTINKVRVHLGTYCSALEASQVYEAHIKYMLPNN